MRSATKSVTSGTWRPPSTPSRILSSWQRQGWRTEPRDPTWSCAGMILKMVSLLRFKLSGTRFINWHQNWIIHGKIKCLQLKNNRNISQWNLNWARGPSSQAWRGSQEQAAGSLLGLQVHGHSQETGMSRHGDQWRLRSQPETDRHSPTKYKVTVQYW